MTKDIYFEMCEALGNEPVEDEIPVDANDFPAIVQQSLTFYGMLRDMWDTMNGVYLGKDMSSIFDFFSLYDIDKEECVLQITLIQYIDVARAKLINSKKPKTPKPPKR